MSKTIPALLLAHLRGEVLTTALCWRIVKNDDTEIRGTDHDRDVTLQGGGDGDGTYRAGSNITGSQARSTNDAAVDNMDVQGAMPSDDTRRIDVNVHDIEAGLFANASVFIYLTNWADPSMGYYTVKRGFLGDINRDTDGAYTTEIRGLKQALQQTFVRTYSERCQVRNFGDAECGVDVDALEQTGAVTSVASRRRFNATLTGGNPAGYFSLGTLTFVTGDNAGIEREVRRDDEDDTAGHLSTWDQYPAVVQVGDTFTIRPGCDRRASTCKTTYDNLLNFRGHGIFIEGLDALQRGPT